VAFGLCGYFWRRLPPRSHPFLTPLGCLAGAAGYAAVALDQRAGGPGGAALQLSLSAVGASLALAFSPLVTHALVGVQARQAADASGLLTTAIQLGQAIGVAAFGSVFLTLSDRGAPATASQESGHALAVTLGWIALAAACAAIAAVPLSRTVRAASDAEVPGGPRQPATSGRIVTR